jgi:N-methylhydantoinase A
MAAALNVVSVQRGYDPREFVLIVAGGAGPIHAAPIARDLEIPLVLIPRESSVFCAAGMLISDLKHDYVRTYARDLDKVDLREASSLYKEMTETALRTLKTEGVAKSNAVLSYSADLRYVGQFNEVEVPLSGNGTLRKADLERLVGQFHARHDTLYGYSMVGTPVELINLRVTGRGVTPKPKFPRSRPARFKVDKTRTATRKAYFDGAFREVPVYDGLVLQNGHLVRGPAIVSQPTTTIVVPPDFDLKCDEFNNFLMYPKGENLKKLIRQLRSEG